MKQTKTHKETKENKIPLNTNFVKSGSSEQHSQRILKFPPVVLNLFSSVLTVSISKGSFTPAVDIM